MEREDYLQFYQEHKDDYWHDVDTCHNLAIAEHYIAETTQQPKDTE